MPIIPINKDNYTKEVVESNKPIILDVYAAWCGVCIQMEPIIQELEKELGKKYTFLKLNVDESRELAMKYGVSSIPTFVFIKNNEVQGKHTGYISKEDLLEKIESLLGN